jgi:hypothetical protein
MLEFWLRHYWEIFVLVDWKILSANFCCLLEEGVAFSFLWGFDLGCFFVLGSVAFAGHVVKRRKTSQNVVKRRETTWKIWEDPNL